ncbi:MAG TPA: glycosyltransferase family 39 protein [Candidatus Binataceae bacterium]|nr:glycosyltransferase family 39 protein [Candidatus Binataceae bacterium]
MSLPRGVRLAAPFLIAIVLLAPGLSAPFAKDAEPQSAQWIADIVDHGHWLLPVDYYGFVNRKPPLYYWLSALASDLSGKPVDETRARLVSLIAGAALATIVFDWTAALLGAATGWLAFAFLLGSYGFASRATTALTDMLMTTLLFAIWCAIFPALDDSPSWSGTLVAGVLLGLAILTKGPVVVVILGLALVLYLLMVRRNPFELARRRWPWAMLALAVAIAAAWYVPALAAHRGNEVAALFVSENFGHFMPSSMGGTGEAARPFYYIVMRLWGGMLPLSILFPALVAACVRSDFDPAARAPLRFQLAMALAVLLLFSAANAKRDDYILPAIPSLAILLAALFTHLRTDSKRRAITRCLRDLTTVTIAAAMAIGIIFAIIAATSLLSPNAGDHAWLTRLQSSDASYAAIFVAGIAHWRWPFVAFEAAVLAGAVTVIVGLQRRTPLVAGIGLAITTLAASLLWTAVVRPAEMRTRSLVDFAPAVRMRIGSAPVYVAYFDPEFAWYYGREAPPLPHAIARRGAPSRDPVYLVARPRELLRLAPQVRASLQVLMRADLSGGGGTPALYEIPQITAPPDLKPPRKRLSNHWAN